MALLAQGSPLRPESFGVPGLPIHPAVCIHILVLSSLWIWTIHRLLAEYAFGGSFLTCDLSTSWP